MDDKYLKFDRYLTIGLWITIGLLGILFTFIPKADAAIYYYQSSQASTSALLGAGVNYWTGQTNSSGDTNTSGWKIGIVVENNTCVPVPGTNGVYVNFRQGDSPYTLIDSWIYSGTSTDGLIIPDDYSNGTQTHTLPSGKELLFDVGCSSGSGNVKVKTDINGKLAFALASSDVEIESILNPAPSLSVEMAYPVNSLPPIPDPDAFVIAYENLGSSTGQFGVELSHEGLSVSFNNCNVVNGSALCLHDNQAILRVTGGTKLSQHNFSTTTWTVTPYFFNSGDMSFTYGATTTFDIVPIASLPTDYVSSSILALAHTNYIDFSSSSAPFVCEPAEDWTDIGGGISYGLCRFGQMLFKGSPESVNYYNSKYEEFKTVFPFSVFYTLSGSIGDNVSSTDTAAFRLKNTYLGVDIELLSSSTLKNNFGSSTANMIYNGIGSLAWLTVGVAMFLTFL